MLRGRPRAREARRVVARTAATACASAPPIGRRRLSAPHPPGWPIAPGSILARDEPHESARRNRLERWPRSMARDDHRGGPSAHSTTAETPWLLQESREPVAGERSSGCHRSPAVVRPCAADRSVLTCTPMSSASTGSGRSSCDRRDASPAPGLVRAASAASPAARHPTSDTIRGTHRASPRTPPATDPARSGIHAVCGTPRRSHHAIGAGRREARWWRWAYFSQPILEGDRSLFSPAPSPLVPRQWAQSANSLGKWRARQDSNLRPPA